MSTLWRTRARRVVVVAIGVLIALAASGALYQSVSVRRESGRYPPPGRLVDIGGRRLHLLCLGDGQPTVIFEPSSLGGAISSEAARVEIGAHTRVCSYDRVGTVWSDPGPAIISIGTLTDDLERLLDRADLRPPYILEGASMGGLTAELFARRHPDRVAGLVFVDAGSGAALEHFAPRFNSAVVAGACLLPMAARLGVVRLIDPLGLRREHSVEADRTIAHRYRVELMETICALARAFPRDLQEFRAAPPLAPDVPLVVLTAETMKGLLPPGYASEADSLRREWVSLQQELSRRSSHGRWRIVPGSDHLIGNSRPQAVASAVLEVLAEVRGPAK